MISAMISASSTTWINILFTLNEIFFWLIINSFSAIDFCFSHSVSWAFLVLNSWVTICFSDSLLWLVNLWLWFRQRFGTFTCCLSLNTNHYGLISFSFILSCFLVHLLHYFFLKLDCIVKLYMPKVINKKNRKTKVKNESHVKIQNKQHIYYAYVLVKNFI